LSCFDLHYTLLQGKPFSTSGQSGPKCGVNLIFSLRMGMSLSWNTVLLLTQDDGQNPYSKCPQIWYTTVRTLKNFTGSFCLMQNFAVHNSLHHHSSYSKILSTPRHTVSHRHSNESLGSVTERVFLHQLTYQLNTCHYIHTPHALTIQIWAFCPQLIRMFHMGLRTSSSFKMLHMKYTHARSNT